MDVNDEVKGYLARAVRKGVSVGRVVAMAERAGFEIKSHRNTLEKFLREDGRRLADADDLNSLKEFFTTKSLGPALIGGSAADVVSLGGDNTTRAREGAEDARVEPRRMAVRIGPGPSQRPDTQTDLGTIAIYGNQWGQGTVSVEIRVYCNIWEGMTLQRVRIDVDPHSGSMSRDSRRHWNKPQRQRTELQGREGHVQLRCWNSEFDPFWQADGLRAPVGCFEYPDFAALEGLSPGGRVTVTLTARLRDLSYDDEDNQRATERRDDLLEVDDDGRPRTTTPQEISKSRRRVLALIHQDGLNIGTNGNVEIASHVLVIVKEGE